MTPHFTTPCFVRVEDADKRKEICQQLQEMGYAVYLSATLDTFYWICTYLTDDNKYDPYILGEDFEDAPDNSSNCGTNIDLFLALASMRSDTDKGQWFINDQYGQFHKCSEIYIDHDLIFTSDNFRKATATEIVEYFKKQIK